MADETFEQLSRDMDLIADGFPQGAAFWTDCWVEFKALLGGAFPELAAPQQVAAFERWGQHYLAREQAQERERTALVAGDLRERDELWARLKLLPADSPERAAIQRQLWALGYRIADRFRPTRPEPMKAKWAVDE